MFTGCLLLPWLCSSISCFLDAAPLPADQWNREYLLAEMYILTPACMCVWRCSKTPQSAVMLARCHTLMTSYDAWSQQSHRLCYHLCFLWPWHVKMSTVKEVKLNTILWVEPDWPRTNENTCVVMEEILRSWTTPLCGNNIASVHRGRQNQRKWKLVVAALMFLKRSLW